MAINTQNVCLKMTAGRKDQFPRDALPQIALSGRSNVGKSSLINTVLGRKSLARTSAEPGKTITVNFYEIDKGFKVGFTTKAVLVEKDFPQPCIQLEIEAYLPWVMN